MWFVLLSTLTAHAGESCTDPFASVASWELPSSHLQLDRGILASDHRIIGVEVSETAVRGDRVVFVEYGDFGLQSLVAWDATTDSRTVLVQGQTPGQPALSPDGRWVAYVNGVTGFSAVWAVPFEGGEPVQLTNADLVRTPGRAPAGFIPGPQHGFAFDGGLLTWSAEDIDHSVALPGGAQ